MYNSILKFNEIGREKIEKIIKNFVMDEDKSLGDLVMELEKPLQELQRDIIKEVIEEIDKAYRENKSKRKKYNIERRNEKNSVLTTCGSVKYERTYFENIKTGEHVFLADKAVGITKNMRKSEDVSMEILENAADMSYRLSGKKATKTEDVVSKQAVMKEIHEIEIPKVKPKLKNGKKRKKKKIYINADEDHVSLQFLNEKGDIKENENGYKNNTEISKLIYVYEGKEKESPKSKRTKLINKYCFGGIEKNSDKLWEEVMEHIAEVYEEEYIEKIYIIGDGASWIKKGVEVLGAKAEYVLDKFHLKRYIERATLQLGKYAEEVRQYIYDEISFEDKEGLKRIFDLIKEKTLSEKKTQWVIKAKNYILNHWEAITIRNENNDINLGCSAEGNVSHIFSSRLSSRPLGWSIKGVDQMARLRIYKENGGKVYDLVKYQKEKNQRQIKEQIQIEVDKSIRKKRNRYLENWNTQNIATDMGKRTGMYHLMKELRGIC
ncbi:MAG: ISLre2 family transposase [Eubacteriales bacterium]